jgi:16S rRNA (guanine966-N2)-methyltransferase
MSDKVRGALFNTLGDLDGLTLLDAFAGSGALAFEAVSRGADRVVVIDSDRSAQQAIADNIRALSVANRVKLIRASASAWLTTSDEGFDIILCDPPYDDPQPTLLGKLAERAREGGLVVLSLPPAAEVALGAPFQPIAIKNYGDAELRFYRKVA